MTQHDKTWSDAQEQGTKVKSGAPLALRQAPITSPAKVAATPIGSVTVNSSTKSASAWFMASTF